MTEERFNEIYEGNDLQIAGLLTNAEGREVLGVEPKQLQRIAIAFYEQALKDIREHVEERLKGNTDMENNPCGGLCGRALFAARADECREVLYFIDNSLKK